MKFGWIGTGFQHIYWFFLGPPMVTTLLFPFQIAIHIFSKKLWLDLFFMSLYFVRFGFTFVPLIGWEKTIFFILGT